MHLRFAFASSLHVVKAVGHMVPKTAHFGCALLVTAADAIVAR